MDYYKNLKIKSLGKALTVLSCFTIEHPVLGATDLSEQLGISKTSIHNILATFCEMGYLTRHSDGRYSLGLKILEYAYVINQNLGYPNAVYDILLDAASRAKQVVYFGIPFGTKVLYLYVAHPRERMQELPYRDILGETAPLYCTGIGKAILAHMPESEWAEHLPKERIQFQTNTITDLDAIFQELRRIRSRGYAVDECEHEVNRRCVGVPVYSAAKKLVAGISMSGPPLTMTDEKLFECAGIPQNAAQKMVERIYH